MHRIGMNALHAFEDPFVGRALAAIHEAPARAWTVRSLARVAGLSRAPFARRFKRAVGSGALAYVLAHRLAIAQMRLLGSELTLAQIAADLGYASEFAFAKAFKRVVGIAPGRYRTRGTALTPEPSSLRVRAAA